MKKLIFTTVAMAILCCGANAQGITGADLTGAVLKGAFPGDKKSDKAEADKKEEEKIDAALQSKKQESDAKPRGSGQKFTLTPEQRKRVEAMSKAMDNFVPFEYKPEMASWPQEKVEQTIQALLEKFMLAVYGTLDITEEPEPLKEGGYLIKLLSSGAQPVFIDDDFDYSFFIKDDTDVLIINELHNEGIYKQLPEIFSSLKKTGRMSGVGSEFIGSRVKKGIAAFKKTGDVAAVRHFSDVKTVNDAMNKTWLPYVRDIDIIPLEESADIRLGINFEDLPVYKNNNFINYLESAAADLLDKILEDAEGTLALWRNIRWNKKVEENLKPGKFLVLHIGGAHGAYNTPKSPSLADLLRDNGRNVSSVMYITSLRFPELNKSKFEHANRRFAVKVPENYKNEIPFDFMVYAPFFPSLY